MSTSSTACSKFTWNVEFLWGSTCNLNFKHACVFSTCNRISSDVLTTKWALYFAPKENFAPLEHCALKEYVALKDHFELKDYFCASLKNERAPCTKSICRTKSMPHTIKSPLCTINSLCSKRTLCTERANCTKSALCTRIAHCTKIVHWTLH